jgi:SAM-dependent methyltransferase
MAPSAAPLPKNLRVTSTLPEAHAGFPIDEAIAQTLQQAEETHFWHRSRNAILLERLAALGALPPARLIELGCGSGAATAHLSRHGYDVVGVDGHLDLVACAARRAPEAQLLVHDLTHGVATLSLAPADVVAFFDVIEHLDDPVAALRDGASLLLPGGLVVGTVPARMDLWSRTDVDDGHRVRYEPATLSRTLLDAGLEPVEIEPFHRCLYPLMFAQRRVLRRGTKGETGSRVVVPPRVVNEALYLACRAERRYQGRHLLPGTSLFFAAKPR